MPSRYETNSLGLLLAAIVVGALIAGSVDILVASAIYEASPAAILQAITSGLLGRASYGGGVGTMALGLVLQWLMSLIIAAIYGAAAVQVPVLFDKPLRFGALYGVGVFIVMSFIVVPLSAAYPRPQPSVSGLVLNLAANMLFGVIVASTPSLMRVGRRTAPI
jgi:uncharacterized membrane protein YagU involved in acid resistance